MTKSKPTDLEQFIEAFGSSVKNIKPGRVMFKAKDLDRQVTSARQLIEAKKLNLKVVNDADMASYNAFEVWEA
ncbi:hypothetical protein [Pedobacter nototheniae]|uniref:hypothetical protein n=1 Tax=Pedobacter nototheniae TaxID=2488994 RepID=UPI001038D159|nr:hypothetical protein [Pedobacter nototheniae]